MEKKWVSELARDLVAFGSVPFLILTIVRVSVLQTYYPMQFIISSAVFFGLRAIFKGTLRSGIALILVIFVSIFYHDLLFTIFAALVYFAMIASMVYLKEDRKELVRGTLLGGISAGVGYTIVRLAFF